MMDGVLLVTASWWLFVYLGIDIYIPECECERGKREVPFLNLSLLVRGFSSARFPALLLGNICFFVLIFRV